jgi:hypothetical protein
LGHELENFVWEEFEGFVLIYEEKLIGGIWIWVF